MPTENDNLQPIVRDIGVLLNLNTYQDMSDEEIEIVINYKISQALISNEHQNKLAAINYKTQQQLESYRRIESESTSVLQSMLSQQIPWATVSEDGTVIQNV